MPITSQSCTNDDILQALQAHKERIGQTVLDARPLIKDLQSRATTIDNQILIPMEKTLDRIFASTGMTTQDLIKIGGFQTGANKAELEATITDLGLSVVNGRVLVTSKGDVDISSVKDLHRLVGSIAKIKSLVPELGSCSVSDDMSAGADFKSRFIVIATCQKTVLVPGVGCKADSQLVTEEVVGIDKPIAQILLDRTDLVRGDLVIYIFWLGVPEARQGLRERALNYGLTEDEYFNSILKKSAENFRVKVIDKPYLQICLLSSFFGDDTDDVLHNGFGKNKKLKVKLSPQPQDILDEITLSGILTSQPSRVNSKGLEDFGCTPLLLLSVIDFEKTFGSDNNGKNNCIDASADLSGFFDGLFGGMDSVSEALNTLINEIVKGFMGILNKITSYFSTINAFLLKLLSCLFPLGGMAFTVDSPIFRDLIDLLLESLDLFEGFFSALSDLLNILAPLACIKASLADLAGSSLSSIPGLACVLGLFQFDLCLNISLDIGGIEAGLAFKALSDALTNLKNLLVTLTSLSIGFPSSFAAVSCLPTESAILMVKLGLRGAIASAGLPL